MPNQFNTDIPQYNLHYEKYGHGENVLLTFHGFGQTNADFSPFHEQLGNQYTIFSFDLFFHGSSTWANDDFTLDEVHLKSIFSEFLESNEIDRFSLTGFSMGGRFAFMITKLFPNHIHQLILIAPDGLHKSFGYRLVTGLSPVRKLFHYTVNHPKLFFVATRIIKSLGIIDKKLIRFGESQMKTIELREKVYLSWTVFRKLFLAKKKFRELMINSDIETMVYLGKHDKVIPPKKIAPYFNKVSRCSVIILDVGHGSLIEATSEMLTHKHR